MTDNAASALGSITGRATGDPIAEQVVARLRSHSRVLFWPTALLIVVCGGAGFFYGRFPEAWQNLAVVAGAVFTVLFLWLLPLAVWLSRRYTITTRRIIFSHGFFVRTRQELLHSRGYDVTVRRNWLQLAFRSGTVLINSGLEHPLVLKDVPGADLVQQVLHDLMERSQTLIGARRQEQAANPARGSTLATSAPEDQTAFWGQR